MPGPNDPWASEILPRPPIPKGYHQKLSRLLPRAIFTTNPCRLRFCSQEIVLFRDELMAKMLRNSIMPYNDKLDPDPRSHVFPSFFILLREVSTECELD